MKTMFRILGITAMAVIMAFSFTACEGPEGPMGPQGIPGDFDPDCEHLYVSSAWVTTTPATCTETGTQTRMCVQCREVLTNPTPLAVLGHIINAFTFTTEPTEIADGSGIANRCSRTGCSYVDESITTTVTIPARNKFYGTWIGDGYNRKITITANSFRYEIPNNENYWGEYTSITWTPAGNTVATGDNRSELYPAGYTFTGTRNASTAYDDSFNAGFVALSPDGQTLVAGASASAIGFVGNPFTKEQ